MRPVRNGRCILITGAAGFVGINVTRYLVDRGHRVVAFDYALPPKEAHWYLGEHCAGIVWVTGDVRDDDQVRRLLDSHGVDTVLHAAAVTPGNLKIEKERARGILDVNVMGTLSVLEASNRAGCRRVIVVGSCSAIGAAYRGHGFIPEDAHGTPTNLYGISKLAQELMTRRYKTLRGMEAVTVRLSHPYGPMERPSADRFVISPIGEWMEAAAAGRPLMIVDLDAEQDWIYIDDLAAGVAKLVTAPALRHPHYNLGFGDVIRVRHVLAAIRQAYPEADVRLQPEATPNRNLLPEALRPPLEMSRLRDEFRFHPKTDIETGIASYATWLDARDKAYKRAWEAL